MNEPKRKKLSQVNGSACPACNKPTRTSKSFHSGLHGEFRSWRTMCLNIRCEKAKRPITGVGQTMKESRQDFLAQNRENTRK